MKCNNCNYQNADTAVFCANCGTKIETLPLPVLNVDGSQQSIDPNQQQGQQSTNPSAFPAYHVPQQTQQPVASQSQPSFPAYGVQQQHPTVQPTPNEYYPKQQKVAYGRTWASITSLVCGILSFPCCITGYGGFILAIAAIVFGAIGINSSNRVMSIIGLSFGIVGLILATFMLIVIIGFMQDPELMNEFQQAFQIGMNL